MYIIYCLKNESFKNILHVGSTESITSLNQFLRDINKIFLPTPYTIFLTKQVSDATQIEDIYNVLARFGKQLNNAFFEISPDIIKQLFDLLEYKIVQNGIEYIIPILLDTVGTNIVGTNIVGTNIVERSETIYSVPNISDMVNEIDIYDRLSRYEDLDL